jgi:manganese transport protein
LNLTGLPDSIAAFFGENASAAEISMAHDIAYVLIVAVLALLAWTVIELYKGNKRYEIELAEKANAKEAA